MQKFVDPHDPYRVRGRRARPGNAMAFIERALAAETDDCIMFPFARSADGYARLKYEGRDAYGHVLVCERAQGERPSGMVAAHSCGKAACVNKRDLRWATHAENSADRRRHGTDKPRRLPASDQAFIGRLLANAMRYRDIACMYGVSGSTVSEIVRKQAVGRRR